MNQVMIKPPWPTGDFAVGAKAFNNGDDPTDYYVKGNRASPGPKVWEGGLIPSTGSGDTYEDFTLVFCVYPVTHDNDAIFIFGTEQSNFTVATYDVNGGLWISAKQSNGAIHNLLMPESSYTDLMEAGKWHAVMIGYDGDVASDPDGHNIKVRVAPLDGSPSTLYDGPFDSDDDSDLRPMDYNGPCYVGCGDFPSGSCGGVDPDVCAGLDCYLSYVWCKEEYLDPDTYWDDFFDANNKPKDVGADGSDVTGSAPDTYCPDGDFTDNKGTAGNWVEVGTVPDAPSSPTD